MARSTALVFLVATMAVAALISAGVEGAAPSCPEAEGCCICTNGLIAQRYTLKHIRLQIHCILL